MQLTTPEAGWCFLAEPGSGVLFGKWFSALFVIENSVLRTARVGKPVFGQAFLLAVSGIFKTRLHKFRTA
jgi:hypothetical protein